MLWGIFLGNQAAKLQFGRCFWRKRQFFLSFLAICSRAAALDGKIEGFVRAVYATPFFWHCKALRIMIDL